MKIAIEGCAHGELEKIYECMEALQQKENIKIDLLICCGDFQAVRNNDDLCAMAVPEKYLDICTFYKYYSGEKRAPILTIFIGGNHEASNYLQELPYGGWVAPNIYYLGRAGVVNFGDIRIGGMSGIYKGRDYNQGFWESPPYNHNSMRSVYHIRALDVFRLKQLKEKVHIMLSHDWPAGITDYGNKEALLKWKPFLREDIENGQLGSPPAEKLLRFLKPDYWFAAHMHCQFAALVPHSDTDIEDRKETKFLALDKCLPRRRFLQVLDIPGNGDGLSYDAEWLAVLRSTNHLMTIKNVDCYLPGPECNERYDFTPTQEERDLVLQLMGDMTITENDFVRTAHAYTLGSPRGRPPQPISNSQTTKLCETLSIDDPLQVLLSSTGRVMKQPYDDKPKSDIIEQTPIKNLKLSLPDPVTPSDSTIDNSDDILFTTDNRTPSLLEGLVNVTEDTSPTPVKKTFKRRNQSIYTPEVDVGDSHSKSPKLSNENDAI